MSSVKKLSLSGFKSTFKRKTSRGSSRNNADNAQQAAQQQHRYVCDIETTKTKSDENVRVHDNPHENISTKTALDNEQNRGIINQNGCGDDQKNKESKTSRWGFRQKSCEKTKTGENASNGNVDTPMSVPGSGANDGELPAPPCVNVNGHILRSSPKINKNESGYVGARWSKTPPQIAKCHSFHEVESSNHQYINDNKSKQTCDNAVSVTSSQCVDENGKKEMEMESSRSVLSPAHKCNDRGVDITLKCDVNDNAEIFEERLDECLENHVGPNENAELICDEDFEKSEVLPPAIPPKPATLFSNGQWVLGSTNSVETRNERNSTAEDSDSQVPPRPPARSKTRHGIDTSLPFYKQYLELKEKSFQPAPVYEDVRVEVGGGGSGGLAGELSKLPRQPWYWGPMAQDEAEEKLAELADGSFLVRDSSDERYLLTLSFKSNGRTLHTRIEHRNGLFSLNDSEGHPSVIELIQNAVKESRKGVFGYMNDSTGIQNYPARLTQWVSRYSEIKSLQYLCRFVIRETYPRHHIRHLPLPKKINEYILENQY